MMLELEQECRNLYRRKIDEADQYRDRIRQAIAGLRAEIEDICCSMEEPPVHGIEVCRWISSFGLRAPDAPILGCLLSACFVIQQECWKLEGAAECHNSETRGDANREKCEVVEILGGRGSDQKDLSRVQPYRVRRLQVFCG
ncbi:uncharacterized protein LOC122001687 [Zingiber officinale]|uniref:uncharacterized protein LOC122001687 n=1 Tax=Zingiber officinale TaxID=94328 RepID=UPI001C4AC6CF|nr:uncharacterized protein LOC122001687 [Zingiber officinale]